MSNKIYVFQRDLNFSATLMKKNTLPLQQAPLRKLQTVNDARSASQNTDIACNYTSKGKCKTSKERFTQLIYFLYLLIFYFMSD